jgi:predicted nucleotidyltransferase
MNYELALGVLSKWDVEFVLVGGAAVVAHGSTLTTQDLDIVYRVEEENVKKLLFALQELDATAHGDPRGLSFGFDHLNNLGHHLNDTRAGRIDALGSIGVDGQIHYEHLVDEATTLEIFGVKVKCISIDQLIAVKRELARPRDLLAVLELEAIKKLALDGEENE